MIYALVMIAAAFMAACSQMLLKLSTRDFHENGWRVYLNAKVITAYFIFAMTMLMNVYAFTGIQYKYGSILASTAYLFTMVLSVLLLKEKVSWRCVLGNCLIIVGIVIYSLGSIH